MDRFQFFFDESGKPDLSDARISGQDNHVLAGFLVRYESPFWDDVKIAWERASDLLDTPPGKIELHAWQLYNGRSLWEGIDGRLKVLDPIFEALRKHKIPIYWSGLPVEYIARITRDKWKKILVQYLTLLNGSVTANSIEVCGDRNDWVSDGYAIINEGWDKFEGQKAGFYSAKNVHGIQIAHVIASTLYRSNKSILSNTDKTANRFRESISRQIIHLPN